MQIAVNPLTWLSEGAELPIFSLGACVIDRPQLDWRIPCR